MHQVPESLLVSGMSHWNEMPMVWDDGKRSKALVPDFHNVELQVKYWNTNFFYQLEYLIKFQTEKLYGKSYLLKSGFSRGF
jgi:hypothetical protein